MPPARLIVPIASVEHDAVYLDLSHRGVEEMAQAVARLLAPADLHLLRPQLRPAHRALVASLDALPWGRPEVVVNEAMAILKRETYPGRTIDPNDDQGDVPWCSMLVRLVPVPHVGSRAARCWFVHLHRLRSQDIAVSSLVESVAAYGVATFERRAGRQHEVERWWTTAGLMTEPDERAGLGLLAVVRAASLYDEPLLVGVPPVPHLRSVIP